MIYVFRVDAGTLQSLDVVVELGGVVLPTIQDGLGGVGELFVLAPPPPGC